MLRARSFKLRIQIKLSSSEFFRRFWYRLMTRRLAAVLKPRFNRLAGNRRGWPLHSFGSGPEGDVDFFGQRNMEVSHGGTPSNLP